MRGGGKEAIAPHLVKTVENQKKRKHTVQEKLERYSSLSSLQSKGKFLFVFLFSLYLLIIICYLNKNRRREVS